MQLENAMRVIGNIELIHRGPNGKIKGRRHVKNLVVTAGEAFLAGVLTGDEASPADMNYLACGTDNTAVATGDTALGVEVEGRVSGTQSLQTTTHTDDTYQVQGTINMTGSHAIVEAGLLDASSGGTMMARQTFSAINVESGDSIQFTWQIAFAG